MTKLEWALECASRGWLVFPSMGKKPLVKWSTEATTDPGIINAWFYDRDHYDVCIKTGAESGLVVVDWDRYKQEDQAWPLGPIPRTYACQTPKGGYHFYFKHPGGDARIANSAGKLAPFVDVRGDGGMVVAYPPYNSDLPAAPPDEWCTPRNAVTEQVSAVLPPYDGDGDGMTLAVDLVGRYAEDVLNAPDGQLNTTLWQRTADAFKMVAAGELREESVLHLMQSVAVLAGHPAEGARNTILSARLRGMLEPTSCVTMLWKEKGR